MVVGTGTKTQDQQEVRSSSLQFAMIVFTVSSLLIFLNKSTDLHPEIARISYGTGTRYGMIP